MNLFYPHVTLDVVKSPEQKFSGRVTVNGVTDKYCAFVVFDITSLLSLVFKKSANRTFGTTKNGVRANKRLNKSENQIVIFDYTKHNNK